MQNLRIVGVERNPDRGIGHATEMGSCQALNARPPGRFHDYRQYASAWESQIGGGSRDARDWAEAPGWAGTYAADQGRERDRSGGVRGGDIGGYRRDNHGQKVQGPSKRNVEMNMQITVCEDSRVLCAWIDTHAAELDQTKRGDCLSKAPSEPARRGAHRGRGTSTAGARRGGPADH